MPNKGFIKFLLSQNSLQNYLIFFLLHLNDQNSICGPDFFESHVLFKSRYAYSNLEHLIQNNHRISMPRLGKLKGSGNQFFSESICEALSILGGYLNNRNLVL